MPLAGTMSIASFSVVLAEVFASVGLSTLIPASFIELARAARRITDGSSGASLSHQELQRALGSLATLMPTGGAPGDNAAATANAVVAAKILQSLLSSI